MDGSKLQISSMGIVAKNKPLDSHIVEITPIEDAPMLNGELTDNQDEAKASGQDDGGGSYDVAVKTTATIKATWLPFHMSNRKTAPDVRRGAQVAIYQFADSDEYFWATLKDDLQLRKLETVVYAFSGTKNEDAPVDGKSYYFLEISTHTKLVHFHTSKADEEPFGYDIQINTGEGTILITDDVGNLFSLDSKNRQIEMKNADGSIVEVNKTNINLSCSDTITLQASKIVEKSSSQQIKTGNLDATAGTGDLRIAAISHMHHKHPDNGNHGGTVGEPVA